MDRIAPPSPLVALMPLFAVQFACWTGMFLMWIGAYPVITLAVLHPQDGAGMRRGVLVLAGCFSWYAALAAALAFLIPRALRHLSAPLLLALGTMVGALGLGALGWIDDPRWLPLAFSALAVGWSALSNLPYAIAGRLVPGDQIDHWFRVFALSTIVPQLAVTAALIFVIGEIDAAMARNVMRAAALAMGLGSVLAVVLRRRLG